MEETAWHILAKIKTSLRLPRYNSAYYPNPIHRQIRVQPTKYRKMGTDQTEAPGSDAIATRTRQYNFTRQGRSERRLQALSRLLQGKSECVAVSLIAEKCYIAANELSQKSRQTNQYIKHIAFVMGYFKDLQKNKSKKTGDARVDLLIYFFTPTCTALSHKTMSIPPNLIRRVIQDVLDNQANPGFFTHSYKKGNAYAFLVPFFQRFYRDFCKVENAVTGELKNFFSPNT